MTQSFILLPQAEPEKEYIMTQSFILLPQAEPEIDHQALGFNQALERVKALNPEIKFIGENEAIVTELPPEPETILALDPITVVHDVYLIPIEVRRILNEIPVRVKSWLETHNLSVYTQQYAWGVFVGEINRQWEHELDKSPMLRALLSYFAVYPYLTNRAAIEFKKFKHWDKDMIDDID